MKTLFENIKQDRFYIWGNGNQLRRYYHYFENRIDVCAIIDSDIAKQGDTSYVNKEMKLLCISPDKMDDTLPVIIAVENPRAVKEITESLDRQGRSWCHIYEVVDSFFLEKSVNEENDGICDVSNDKIVRFIDATIPISFCNLKCSYCYLGQIKVELDGVKDVYHTPEFIRAALSKKRWGGCMFINLCGVGETLLCDELVGIVRGLVEEGHYVQIVTNATITKKVNEFVNSGIDPDHLFFKCSLHYIQLKSKGMLDVFADNVNKLVKSGISITVEITPEDKLVPYIDEIKQYSYSKFGALPHITVARNEGYTDFRLYTDMSREDYIQTWGQFDSPLFEFKINNMQSQNKHDCMAGIWGVELNMATGELYKCVYNPRLYNIYENIEEDIPFEKVGNKCCLPYCFNGHSYLTFGLIPEVESPTYAKMRDRVTIDGKHWLSESIGRVFSQKLNINNKVSNKR